MPKHYAIIPARKDSRGFPGKNRFFFAFTADFLDVCGFFNDVLVTSDDDLILSWAEKRGYWARRRPQELSTDDAVIREAVADLADNTPQVSPEDYLWLTYTTTVHKNVEDFHTAREMVEATGPAAFCTFIEAATHPYITWYRDETDGTMRQYIPNDAVNRQSFPPAWRNYHYLVGFRRDAVAALNGNLLGDITQPIFLTFEQRAALCDLDEPADLEAWKTKHPADFDRWRRSLPTECDLQGLVDTHGLSL